MRTLKRATLAVIGVCGFGLLVAGSTRVQAHCDGLDGPVVLAAQGALASGNVNLALIWVQPPDEPEVRLSFQETLAVRQAGPRARRFADRAFFETLVRLHRAGEGAPYEGLKPAGRDLGPAIPAADRAVARDDFAELETLLSRAWRDGLNARFEHLRAARAYKPDDVSAGRAYVAAYVEFVHYVERLHAAATHDAHGHYEQR